MFSTLVRPSLSLRRAWRRRLAGAAAAALALGIAGTAVARPPFAERDDRSRRQIEDAERAEIRRSLGRPGEEIRPDVSRERRRMSDAERQSLRDAVRDAYGDPRERRR